MLNFLLRKRTLFELVHKEKKGLVYDGQTNVRALIPGDFTWGCVAGRYNLLAWLEPAERIQAVCGPSTWGRAQLLLPTQSAFRAASPSRPTRKTPSRIYQCSEAFYVGTARETQSEPQIVGEGQFGFDPLSLQRYPIPLVAPWPPNSGPVLNC